MARRTKKQIEERKEAIKACRDRYGRILPKNIVAAARNPKSILHDDFEWDDKKAAHQQRLERAQELILEVKLEVVVGKRTIAAPYYVSDPSTNESAYIPTTVAAKDVEIAENVLLAELRRIESQIMRARALAIAFDLAEHFDRMLDSVVEVRGRLTGRKGGEEGDRVSP